MHSRSIPSSSTKCCIPELLGDREPGFHPDLDHSGSEPPAVARREPLRGVGAGRLMPIQARGRPGSGTDMPGRHGRVTEGEARNPATDERAIYSGPGKRSSTPQPK